MVGSSRRRFGRLVSLTGVAVSACLVVSTSPALAGETAPPVTRGYASYNLPKISTTCAAGSPTKVTLSFRYDARTLQRGYVVKLTGYFQDPQTFDEVKPTAKLVTIGAGAHGAITRTFAVPSAAKVGWDFGLWAQTRRKTSDFRYVSRYGRLTCAHTVLGALRAAKVSAGPVNCNHVAHFTFDNSNGNTAWYYTIFFPGGGFAPSGHAVKAGSIEHRRFTDIQAGEVIRIVESAGGGSVFVGNRQFKQGC
jgi:hypothetical protein